MARALDSWSKELPQETETPKAQPVADNSQILVRVCNAHPYLVVSLLGLSVIGLAIVAHLTEGDAAMVVLSGVLTVVIGGYYVVPPLLIRKLAGQVRVGVAWFLVAALAIGMVALGVAIDAEPVRLNPKDALWLILAYRILRLA